MSGHAPLTDLTHRLQGRAGLEITLTHYAAGGRQVRHEHGHSQISFLLAGGIHEKIGRRCHEMTAPSACIKPAGVDHENLWGKCGAMMLTVRTRHWDENAECRFPMAAWKHAPAPPLELIRMSLVASAADDVDALASDLIACLDDDVRPPSGTVPTWLRSVIDALWECEALSADEAAAIAGVHRVHLARAFVRHLGLPFSAYRRQVMASRAIERALRTTDRLADVAAHAGFADQPHMHRTLRAMIGTTPKQLRQHFDPAS